MGLSQTKIKPIEESQEFDLKTVLILLRKNKNKDNVVEFCKLHASKKNSQACLLLGEIYDGQYSKYFHECNYDDTIKYFHMAIECGNNKAYKPLALLYYNGYNKWCKGRKNIRVSSTDPNPNYKKSWELFNEASKSDEMDGSIYNYIAMHHESGYEVSVDYKLAMTNYIKAYELGYIFAINNIRRLFENEKGHEMKSDECLKWMYECLKYYENITAGPDYTNILITLSKVYLARENYEMALKYHSMAKDNVLGIKYILLDQSVMNADMIKCSKLHSDIVFKQEIHRTDTLKKENEKTKQMEKTIEEQKEQISVLLSISKATSPHNSDQKTY